MPQELDPLSLFVGQFGERQTSLEKTVGDNNRQINEKLDRFLTYMNDVDKKAAAAHNRIDSLVSDEGPIKALQAEAVDNRAWKLKSILAMIGISSVSGAGAGSLKDKILALLG